MSVQVWPVIATRDRPDWLRRQLDALCPQLRGTEAVVVVTDGHAASEKIAADRQGVVCVPLSASVGIYRARRAGNAFVPSDAVICELDDHDTAEPDLLEELRAAFVDPLVLAAYCDVYHADPDRRVVKERRKPEGARFAESGQLGVGMKAYRKWVYDCVGGYPLDYEAAGDYGLMCRIEAFVESGGGRIAHIPKCLVTVTEDHTGFSATRAEQQQEAVQEIASDALNGRFRFPFVVLQGPHPKAGERVQSLGEPFPPPAEPSPGLLEAASSSKPSARRPVVCLVTDTVGRGRGGGELSMLGLLRRAHEAGWRVVAVYLRDAGKKPLCEDWLELVRLEGVPSIRWRGDDIAPDLLNALRRVNPHVIVTEAGTAANAGKALRAAGYPVVTVVQFWRGLIRTTPAGMDALNAGDLAPEHVDAEGCENVAASAAIVANSQFSAEVVGRVLNRKPDAVVYPPVRAEDVVATLEAEPDCITCLSTQPLKGVNIFLALAAANPGFKFLLCAGDARLVKHPEVVERAKALPNVEVIEEWVIDIREVYARTRCLFIGTQTSESFCRSAAEARANGIPILAADVGNLRNIVTPEAGVRVRRDAPLPVWQDALERALALEPEPDARWCQDHSARFIEVLHSVRRLPEVMFHVPNAPGVVVGVRHLERVLGVRSVRWSSPCGPEEDGVVLTIGAGGIEPGEGPGAKGYWWCSHWPQMETSPRDLKRLADLLRDRVAKGAWLFCTDRNMVEDLSKRWPRVRWLPNVYALGDCETAPLTEADRLRLFVPGPYDARKNLHTALAAASRLEAEVVVTGLAARCETLRPVAETLGVPVRMVECPDAEDVKAAARQCHVALCLGTAETFGLAAADCVAAGVPVVHGRGLPCLSADGSVAEAEDLLFVPDVVCAIEGAVEERDAVAARQREVLASIARHNAKAIARHNAKAARKALMEALHA